MALAVAAYALSSRAAQNLTHITTECLPSCAKQYRSLPGIVLSCFTTIFLCIWVALHLNVPEPRDTRSKRRLARFWIWVKSQMRCTVVPILVTLVFPEWVLGIAALQYIKAGELAAEIRELPNGNDEVTRQYGFFILMGGFHLFEGDQTPPTNRSGGNDGEYSHLPAEESSIEARNGQRGRTASNQTSLIVEFGEPLRPLTKDEVLDLLKTGKLRLPTSAELDDKCKSDGVAKFLVIVQTLWFIAQCIARKVSKLPLTELEVITFGYTLLTVAMYIAWWDKPYRLKFPVRVYDSTLGRRKQEKQEWAEAIEHFLLMALFYATGTQGEVIDLESVKRVPMFYSGRTDVEGIVGGVTAVFVGALFGAVHFLAWSSPFPSAHMQFLWRFATIVMTAAPAAAAAVIALSALIVRKSDILGGLIGTPSLLLLPLYFAGRGITIVIALVTLVNLPLEAYRDVKWSDFFPHI